MKTIQLEWRQQAAMERQKEAKEVLKERRKELDKTDI